MICLLASCNYGVMGKRESSGVNADAASSWVF